MTDCTYAEIDAMRAKLAKLWHQTVDQVTEDEARYFLREGFEKRATSCYRGTVGCLMNGDHHIVCKS